jgi:5,10-methylenetetrahydromethanopterin reductase
MPASRSGCTHSRSLGALAGLGIERLIVVPGSLDADPAEVERANERFAAEVLPALRSA